MGLLDLNKNPILFGFGYYFCRISEMLDLILFLCEKTFFRDFGKYLSSLKRPLNKLLLLICQILKDSIIINLDLNNSQFENNLCEIMALI